MIYNNFSVKMKIHIPDGVSTKGSAPVDDPDVIGDGRGVDLDEVAEVDFVDLDID